MERTIIAAVLALVLAAHPAAAQEGKKKKAEPAGPAGPFGLPTLAQVKEKCSPTAEQAPKLEAVYADAAKNEGDIRKRAKEAESDRQSLEKFLTMGRIEVVNKVKEILDDGQDMTYDGLVAAVEAAKTKKK
ncbi:MAG TPA: hypothetical protein VEJ18_20385 [Planctomycetota bacterium]|nr:hypothetical protein [Planctomycetota bacterium]